MVQPRVIAKKVLPPFMSDLVRSLVKHGARKPGAPRWLEVTEGELRGWQLFLNSSDDFARRMLDGTYEAPFAAAMISRVQPGWVCFDIGAHLGYYSLLLAKLTGSKGQVHAFEPLPFNIDFLRRHIEQNNQSDVIRIHAFALSNASGITVLRASNTLEYSSMAVMKGVRSLNSDWHQQVFADFTDFEVEKQCLDSLVSQRAIPTPHLIKIDVEGAELSILQGAKEILRQAKPIIVAELHTAANAVDCTSLLIEAGYRIQIIEDVKSDWCQIIAE